MPTVLCWFFNDYFELVLKFSGKAVNPHTFALFCTQVIRLCGSAMF